MVKDRIGNELEKGHLVELTLGAPQVMGFITDIQSGGIIAGVRKGGQGVTPGIVTVMATFTFPFDPTNPVMGNLVRLVDPAQGKDDAVTPLPN